MLSFEEAGKILDDAVDALPAGIYEDLNGGVNLVRKRKVDEDGRYIMGLYHRDALGRYVEIFYGSFAELYRDADDAVFAEELVKTLHHELTHHVEDKAGDKTLERKDVEETLLWRSQTPEPLETDSILFADDGDELGTEALRLFRDAMPDFPKSGAARCGEVTAELLEEYGAVLCMTLAQADALAERFPQADGKILCLGERDILPPLKRCRRQLRREIQYLAKELSE